MLKANDDIVANVERRIKIDQVICNQPANSFSTEAITVIIVVGCGVCTQARCGVCTLKPVVDVV